ncbi:MAG: hypothetical protein M1837_002218 [Sclerophora amabilis]|nr:MAG: hypothetical protein M1837_002218 [Sclerophora amabilis]
MDEAKFLAENRGPTLITVGWIFTSLAIVVVVLRLFTRFRLTRNSGLDDYFIIASLVSGLAMILVPLAKASLKIEPSQILSVASTSIATAAAVAGCGKHLKALTPEQQAQAIKLNLISEPFGILSFCVPKISVALLIKRIMPPNKLNKWQLRFIFFITISLTIASILCAVFLFAQCSPPNTIWNHRFQVNKAICWPPNVLTNFTIFTGVYSAFTDLYLAIFPITLFWNLQIHLRTKIGLCAVMSLGVLAALCSIIKTTKLKGLEGHTDFTWETVYLLTWTIIEANVIIIAACIPTLRPMVRLMRGRYSTSSHQSNDERDGYYVAFDGNEPTIKSNPESVHRNPKAQEMDKSRFRNPSGGATAMPLNNITRTVEIQTEWERI